MTFRIRPILFVFRAIVALSTAIALPPLCGRASAETATAIVTTTADVVADDGVRSLREAITYANANPGTIIRFNIRLAQAQGGVFTIKPTSLLPQITASGTVIDGATQTAATGDTNAAGPEIELDGTNAGGTWGTWQQAGLFINNAANCVVNRLTINSFAGLGIRIFGTGARGNRVTGCYLGTNFTGTAAKPNGNSGITLGGGASGTLVGNGTVAGRNVIAGNTNTNVGLTDAGTDYNRVQGNYIGTNAAGTARLASNLGIHINDSSSHNFIGGTTPGTGNVIVGVNSNVKIEHSTTSFNVVQGNMIGTDKTGMTAIDATNHSFLVTGGAHHNLIGGTTAAARNVITNGSPSAGGLTITFSNDNTVQGNYVGINAAGTGPIGTGNFGLILYAASHNTVGGTAAGAGNVIAGNHRIGLWIFAEENVPRARYNIVQGNLIGTNPAGTAAIGSRAIGLEINGGCDHNVIGLDVNGTGKGNVIAYSTTSTTSGYGGVRFTDILELGSFGNTVRGNSIYGHAGLAMDIRVIGEPTSTVTPNDAVDADTGPNGVQNFPVLTSALAATTTTIRGTLNSTPNSNFVIDFFSNAVADPSGYGQGQTYLGSINTSTNASGDTIFAFVAGGNLNGRFIAATATNRSTGDTSEFSAHRKAVPPVTIRGRIANHSGAGVGGVSVSMGGGQQSVTDANGDYILINVAPGRYTVAPVITPALIGVTFAPASYTVTVAGSNLSNINFTTSYTVSGRVANHSGTGIPNVPVQRVMGASVVSAVTGPTGVYTFTGVRSGIYTIAPVLTPAMSGMTFTPASKSITIDRNNLTNQNFIATFTISGRITNSAGAGIAKILVKRVGASSLAAVYTDANGYYTFVKVPNGSYTLTPQATGVTFTPASRAVTVATVNLANQNFFAAFSISGRVTNSDGVGVANVPVKRIGNNALAAAYTDANGYYTLLRVPSGSYTLLPEVNGVSFMPASRAVTITAAGAVNQNFIATFSISGRITDSAGVGLANVLVKRIAGSSIAAAYTDASGNYKFSGVRSGSYTLTPVLTGRTFVPTSRSVTISTANIANQNFTGSG